MLKKFIYGLAMLGAMTACSDDYDDWSAPQANNPEEAKQVTFEVKAVEPIDLATLEEEDSVAVIAAELTAEDGAKVSYQLALSNDAQDKSAELVADAQGRVAVADLAKTVVDFYGKRPTQRTLLANVAAYVDINGQVVKKTAKHDIDILVTPVAPIIESAYHIVGDGIGWSYDGAMKYKFNHSGKDVYDDPVFTITVPAPCNEDGSRKDFYFKIVPASALTTGDLVWDGVLGSDVADGDDRPEAGMAVAGGAFCQHAADEAKFYKITLNMMDYKLNVEALSFVEWIFMPGNPQGWNPGNAPGLRSPNFDGVYVGYGRLDGEFKFTKGHDWGDGEYNFGNFNTYGEGFVQGGGSNIKWTGEAGYYKIVADVANGSLTATKTAWGIIGPAQPGGWNKDTDMTYNAKEDCWEAKLNLKADDFKFRANDDWGINFGGANYNDLTEGGNNLIVAEAGNYTVKLFISCSYGKVNRYCTLTKN